MNIIIVGCGKVGYTIAQHLSVENHNIVIIDKKSDDFDKIVESIDVMVVRGNGLTRRVLNEASAKTADLVICVTNSDETNILCGVTAKNLGAKRAVARVRDPEYAQELYELKKHLNMDLIINPEQQSALEISRLLRFPSASDIETFVGGRVEVVAFKIDENSPLANKKVVDAFRKFKIPVLAAAIDRSGTVIIPNGETLMLPGDKIRIMGKPANITDFLRVLGMSMQKLRDVLIIGGGKIAHYLSQFLRNHQMRVKIIEIDPDQCARLSEDLPDVTIINGDGTDEEILKSEMLGSSDAVVCLTDWDEQNIITALYARHNGMPKTIVKINHINLSLVRSLDIGSIVCPKNTTAYQIIRYVRGLDNSSRSSSIKTMYRLLDNGEDFVEALEFDVLSSSKCIGVSLMNLNIKESVLIGCIVRAGKIIIPTGSSHIEEGDTAIILSKNENIFELDDILNQ